MRIWRHLPITKEVLEMENSFRMGEWHLVKMEIMDLWESLISLKTQLLQRSNSIRTLIYFTKKNLFLVTYLVFWESLKKTIVFHCSRQDRITIIGWNHGRSFNYQNVENISETSDYTARIIRNKQFHVSSYESTYNKISCNREFLQLLVQ